MASFLATHPAKRMTLLPPAMAKATLLLAFFWYCYTLGFNLVSMCRHAHVPIWEDVGRLTVELVCTTLIMVCPVQYMLQCAVDLSRLDSQIKAFSILNAHCACEADRDFIRRNVKVIAKRIGLKEIGPQEESPKAPVVKQDSVQAFEAFVRAKVPEAVARCKGPAGCLPYTNAVFICAPTIMTGFDRMCADATGHWIRLLTHMHKALLFYPLMLALIGWMVERFSLVRKPAYHRKISVMTIAIVITIYMFSGHYCYHQIRLLYTDSTESCYLCFGVLYVTFIALCRLAYRKGYSCQCLLRKSEGAHTGHHQITD